MSKTDKKKHSKGNKTRKNSKSLEMCPIGLKPFEAKFSAKLPSKSLTVTNQAKKKEFVKELMSKFTHHSIKPNNDFYDYINYLWLKNVSLEKQQKYIVQIDDFRLTQDKVYHQLNEIIVDYYKTHNDKLAKNLKNYYTSVIEMNPKNYTKKLALEAVKTIDNYFSKNNPWALLAFFNNDEMTSPYAPFVWGVYPDDKNNKQYRCYISPGQTNILDINVYYDDGIDVAYKRNYRNVFHKYVNKIFTTLLGPNHGYNPKDVFNVEKQISNAIDCRDINKNQEASYNKVFAKESLDKYGFNWEELAKHIGYKKVPEFFISSGLNYLKCGSDLLVKNWNTPEWKTYWLFSIFKNLIRITRGWEKIIFDFKGKFERGQEALNETDAVSASLYMSIPFNTFLTNEYVKKYENPQAMKYVEILCEDLRLVFKRIMMRNKWMAPSTKNYALKKLENFKFLIGKPDNLRADPDLDYGTIIYDNMKKINDWRHQKFIELEGKGIIDIPMMDWANYPVKLSGNQAYIVNASYTPNNNTVYINLGYIQKPFVDLDERGIEYNLAHIGYTIAHELGHGFDDYGSQYGSDGNLHNWWTLEDKKKYKAIQDDVIRQYEEFAARDGIKFDASIGIGEDLADIQGLAVCSEYLRDFQEKNQDLVPIRYLGFEAFFTYFAFEQKQFVSKKAISAQLKTNPHPLDKYRCNVPLSRSEIFRAIYNVKPGDGMWWHNTNTVW
jgi:putative endopeptidase